MSFVFADHVKTFVLEGTEAQVRWAKTIRQQKAVELQRLGTVGIAKALRPHIADEDLERISCNTARKCSSLVSAIAVHALSCPDAGWWLNHRGEKPVEWLPRSARIVIDHYIAKGVTWPDEDSPPWDP